MVNVEDLVWKAGKLQSNKLNTRFMDESSIDYVEADEDVEEESSLPLCESNECIIWILKMILIKLLLC